MWPAGLGFERYYGFLNGETNQWTPNLIRDQHHVEPPRTPDEGYHLEADLTDQAIAHLHELRLRQPGRPFRSGTRAVPRGTCAPHQAPASGSSGTAARLRPGLDAWRAEVLERQKQLGIVPASTTLPPLPSWVEPWDAYDVARRRLYVWMMEVFAGFVSHLDHHLGRLLAHLEQIGERDNTIVCMVSDNGAFRRGRA